MNNCRNTTRALSESGEGFFQHQKYIILDMISAFSLKLGRKPNRSPRLPPHSYPPLTPLHPHNRRPTLLVPPRKKRRPRHAFHLRELLHEHHCRRQLRRANGPCVRSEARRTPLWAGRLRVDSTVRDVLVEYALW